MIALKKLVFELDQMLRDKDISNIVLLRSLVDDALTYLNRTKTFEYSGPIRLPGCAFKLVDLKADFDDIVKAIVDKRTDIEFNGELALIIEETKKDEK